MQRRVYTEEFKRQAVELADKLGNPMAAAKQLGIADSSICTWRSRFSDQHTAQPSELTVSELEELKRLRKEVHQLKQVNFILKKAAAFFSLSSSLTSSSKI